MPEASHSTLNIDPARFGALAEKGRVARAEAVAAMLSGLSGRLRAIRLRRWRPTRPGRREG